MTCTLYLLVSTSLLFDSLSWVAVPRSVCSLVSLVFLLPCLLLTDLRPVSTLSLLCSLAHILIRWQNKRSNSFVPTLQQICTGWPDRLKNSPIILNQERRARCLNCSLILARVIAVQLLLFKSSALTCYTSLFLLVWFISNTRCLAWEKKHGVASMSCQGSYSCLIF